MTKTIHLCKEALARIAYVSNFAADKDIRYYLNAVCLQNSQTHGLTVVATNGHVLAKASISPKAIDSEEWEIIFPIKEIKALTGYKGHMGLDLTWNSVTSLIEIKNPETGCLSTVKAEQCKYPDWHRVVPQDSETLEANTKIGINLKYLALLDKAYKAFKRYSQEMAEAVAMKYHGQGRALVFEPEGVTDIFVLIMPMRV